MKHDLYDAHFTPATTLSAEGARVGIATCLQCGAAILIDPRDDVNRARQHWAWHLTLPPSLAEAIERGQD